MSAFFESATYYRFVQSTETLAVQFHFVQAAAKRLYAPRLFDPCIEVFSRAETGAAVWLSRMELLGLPRYTPLAYRVGARRPQRRHLQARLPRGRVRCWRSLKDKRRAWGLAG